MSETTNEVGTKQTATFAAGCFWGVEATFRALDGVLETRVGYTGGHYNNPTYQAVCSDKTGHAEAVEVTFDPKIISYDQLLNVFWDCHDPTSKNRQGYDIGSQYRSAIFTHNAEQLELAKASALKLQKSGKLKGSIVTQIIAVTPFFEAEEYHQRYHEKHGGNCKI